MKTWRVTYRFRDEERDVIVRATGFAFSDGGAVFHNPREKPYNHAVFVAFIPNVIQIEDINAALFLRESQNLTDH